MIVGIDNGLDVSILNNSRATNGGSASVVIDAEDYNESDE